jgi:hypothetical protein
MHKNITVIVPTLAPSQTLEALLSQLRAFGIDFILVQASDGGVMADTGTAVEGGLWLRAPASRGGQIAAGIAGCDTDWLWVLHDDSRLCAATVEQLLQVVQRGIPRWGRCDVRFQEDTWPLRVVAAFMNLRSRLSKICTGDQGMFFHRRQLGVIGGFPVQPLMEDIEASKRLKSAVGSEFLALTAPLVTSGRRWIEYGYTATILDMWRMRWRYFFGASPAALFQQYYRRQN